MKDIENAQYRTDSKLRYAELHLEELHTHVRKGSGDDFERSHQEVFLYQLVGVRDAFLQELNLYCCCRLELHKVSLSRIRQSLSKRGVHCRELAVLSGLEKDPGSWLNVAKEMRDHSTHRRGVPRVFNIGGDEDGKVTLQDPRTKDRLTGDQIQVFDSWLKEMRQLISALRSSAFRAYQSKKYVNTE